MLTSENIRDIFVLGVFERNMKHGGRVKTLAQQTLLKASQVAELLGAGWSRQRVHMELKRGTLGAEPTTHAGNIPLWTPKQVDQIKRFKGIQTT